MRAMLMSAVFGAMVFSAAAAQAAPASVEQAVKIPFAFTVNGHELPAGNYAVRRDDDQSSALLIQGQGKSIYVLTTPVTNASASPDTSLVFKKDGDRYLLSEIWSDAGDGVAVTMTR